MLIDHTSILNRDPYSDPSHVHWKYDRDIGGREQMVLYETCEEAYTLYTGTQTAAKTYFAPLY